MKKHLLGLAIFSFIVVSFAVAFGFFYVKKIRKVEYPTTPVVETDKRKSCDYPKKRTVNSSFKFTQATLQKNKRQFDATIESEDLRQNAQLILHFFVNDGKNTNHLVTRYSMANKIYIDGKAIWKVQLGFSQFQNQFSSKNNFYVIPEIISAESEIVTEEPMFNEQKFDANKAVSILWVDDDKIVKVPLD